MTVYKAEKKSRGSKFFVVWKLLLSDDTRHEYGREIASSDFRTFAEAAALAAKWNADEKPKPA